MPPKAKFTKAEIIEAALNIVRTDGYEALTSRALGTYLDRLGKTNFYCIQKYGRSSAGYDRSC